MAKKKRKPKKLPTPPAASPSPESGRSRRNLASKLFRPRALSTFAFGLSGLLAGLLTGLNHFPSLGQTAPIPKMMLLAAYLGDPHVDLQAGLSTALAGLLMGASLGFSALSNPLELGLSALLSFGFAIAVFTFTGSVLLTGLAFLLGHTPAFIAWHRLRAASEA